MTILTKMVANLSEEDRWQIIKDYEQFTKDGYIGDSLLRDLANNSSIGFGNNQDPLWMRQIAIETYMYYAYKYLELVK